MADSGPSPVMTVTEIPASAQQQPGLDQASSAVYSYDRVSNNSCSMALKEVGSSEESLVTIATLSSPSASAHSATSLAEGRHSAGPSLPGYSSAPRPESRGSPASTKSGSPNIRASGRTDSAATELRSMKTGPSASAPPATSPVNLLSLRSPSNFLDSHSTSGLGGAGNPFNTGGNNFSWSPTTTMFFGTKSNGLPSARFSAFTPFKRETLDASPITPSLFTSSGSNGNDGQHSYYSGSSRFGNIIDGSGSATNHHTDWNVQTTSWTGLPTPSSEAVLKSLAGSGSNHVHSSLHVESSSWEGLGSNSLVLHSASQKLLDGNAANGNGTLLGGHASPALFRSGGCANGMLPPTPRTVLSGVTNSRAIPRSAGFSWLYQDMAMPNLNSGGNINTIDQFPNLGRPSAGSGQHINADLHLHHEHQQQNNGSSGGHIFNFSPPQTTLGRPPLSARAPRLRPNGIDSGVNTHGHDWQSEHGHASYDGSSSSVHAHSPGDSEVGDGGAAAARYHARVNGTYATEEAKWLAVQNRDPRASASFFYCVLSTKVSRRHGQ
ncbi:hypothetical protein BCV69DRAFT_197459 [Microstroma glucosiphilum]|uniref:Uncharacterized protein n=1 Tax=Pseudomicrostroma glucosiphilum TaxID=1684307 RepID=A0A316U683_9BASI|nr:hypothetical protein BCV69DRAFT_197459 [Pseudomicrostroma glucosiphilum]PWN20722.1 hypothetical protein BCV69DRAFT_197459 [Pseudomicrostroma glucosiphilum]